jgi:hypothetical protein
MDIVLLNNSEHMAYLAHSSAFEKMKNFIETIKMTNTVLIIIAYKSE